MNWSRRHSDQVGLGNVTALSPSLSVAVSGRICDVPDALKEKRHPRRFPDMSPFMAAVVGYVLGESFTDPAIAEITVSEQENLVYIRKAGAVGFDGIQSLEDLRNNWNRLLEVAGLTDPERREAGALFRSKIETVPGTGV